MKVVFMGTPSFAAEILENLAAQHDVVGVYTRPDAVRGRGKKLVASPVKRVAEKHELPTFTPTTLRDPQVQQQIASLEPDVICVAAYGAILPREILDIPAHGCINVHASILPKWRGAAPIERAILAGDETVGVCIMRMEEGLDTGDFAVCRTTDVAGKNATELTAELATLGSSALLTTLTVMDTDKVKWKPQESLFATYAEKVLKHELYIKPADRVKKAAKKVQASSAAHPSKCLMASRAVTVEGIHPVDDTETLDHLKLLKRGHIMLFSKKLYMAFADGPAEVQAVRPDGKRTMTGAEFAAGVQNVKSGLITWEPIDG